MQERREISTEELKSIKESAEKIEQALSYEEYFLEPAILKRVVVSAENLDEKERESLILLVDYLIQRAKEEKRLGIIEETLFPLLDLDLKEEERKINIKINEEELKYSFSDLSQNYLNFLWEFCFAKTFNEAERFAQILKDERKRKEEKLRLEQIEREMKEEIVHQVTPDFKIRETIKYGKDAFGEIYQDGTTITLIYQDKETDLNSFIPSDNFFYRTTPLIGVTFYFTQNFHHPLESHLPKAMRKKSKAIIYGDLSDPIRVFALFHEIGHALDWQKNFERYLEMERKGVLNLEERERNANYQALKLIRKLRREGLIPSDIFSNEVLFNLVSGQLFRKYKAKGMEYHPYLKRKLPKEED